MNGIEWTAVATIVFFSVRGMVSLVIIIWGGRKVKRYFERKNQKTNSS